MTEREETYLLAEKLLDEPYCDPDDDLRMLSRQLLRHKEWVEKLEKTLGELQGSNADLINANRDTILRIHEEGFTKIHRIVNKCVEFRDGKPISYGSIGAVDSRTIYKILMAISTFHPMHGESWIGWPPEEKRIDDSSK